MINIYISRSINLVVEYCIVHIENEKVSLFVFGHYGMWRAVALSATRKYYLDNHAPSLQLYTQSIILNFYSVLCYQTRRVAFVRA